MTTEQLKQIGQKRIQLVRELESTKCFCGAKKVSGQTFCRKHYMALPGRMRSMLYQRLGHGYEEAYAESRIYLETK